MAPLRRMRRPLRRLWRCQSGVEMIEFALVSPVLFAFVLGCLEVSMALYSQVDVEGAMRVASRWGITGQATDRDGNPVVREQYIRDIIASNISRRIDMDTATLTLCEYGSFTDVRQPEPFTDTNENGTRDDGEPYDDLNGNTEWDEDRGTTGAGAAGSVVLYKFDYDWPLLTGMISSVFGKDGKLRMSASIVARNEPFRGTTPSEGQPCHP